LAQERKSQKNNLVVSAGDVVGGGTGDVERQKAEFAFAALGKMGYDAVALGEYEFFHGLDFLEAQMQKYPFFVCTNVVWADTGKPIANPVIYRTYRLDAAPGRPARAITVAIVGVLSDVLTASIENVVNESPRRISILDPFEETRKIVEAARKKAQLVVALAHMEDKQAREMVLQVPGIDIIILGHGFVRRITEPQKVNSTLLVGESNQGKFIAQLILALDSKGKVEAASGTSIPMDEAIADNPEIAKMLNEAKEKWAPPSPPKPASGQAGTAAPAGK